MGAIEVAVEKGKLYNPDNLKIYIDGANPAVIRSLKQRMGEN
jgi:hypothetical protein